MSSHEKAIRQGKLKVGTKQTLRVVEHGKAIEVFVAKDADPRITSKVIELCEKQGIKLTYIDTMKQLGKQCGIDVGAATAAICDE